MEALATILTFVAVAVLGYALLSIFFSEERQVARQLRQMSDWEREQAAEAEPLLQPFARRVLAPVAGATSGALRSLLPANARETMRREIELAGDPGGLTPETLVTLRIAGAVAGAVAGSLLLALPGVGLRSWMALLAIPAGLGIGWVLPGVALDQARRARQGKIRRALPDMLDMLTISVQAGLGFDMALAKLVRNTTGPLSREFSRMLAEVQAGVSRRDALRSLGARTDVPELNSFIMAMVQADVFGVSVANILRSQAVEMRTRRRLTAEEQAQKAPVKMVFPIILCILPSTMLVIIGPAIVAIGRALGIID